MNLVIVSNRLPVTVARRGLVPSAGGLATGLRSVYQELQARWVGWPGYIPQRLREPIQEKLSPLGCFPVFLPKRLTQRYYEGFANGTLWPLLHSFPTYARYDPADWEAYRQVNALFAERLTEVAHPTDTIWVHDYHLMLVPQYLRERWPHSTIGFFLHTPFPSYDLLRLLPWHRELVEGLLHADLIGFHTYDYAQAFLRSVRRVLGHDHSIGQIVVGDRLVQVDVFPMGIDFARFDQAHEHPQVQQEIAKIQEWLGQRKLILSVSRLDYTKGLDHSLLAYEEFLEKQRQWHGRVVYLLVVVPSREGVPSYALQKQALDELVGRITSRYSTVDWSPIRYLYRHLEFHELAALYARADVAVIVPLRDGMNLIAKEYVATRRCGVLILSETAGAAKELREALLVNPTDRAELVTALHTALTMSVEEQVARHRIMRARLHSYDVRWWVGQFLRRLRETKERSHALAVRVLDPDARARLVQEYRRARRRLLLLDYDGTLVPFTDDPQQARPSLSAVALLRKLAQDPKNTIVLISGRDPQTLEAWFGDLPLMLVAEHGAWYRPQGRSWEVMAQLDSQWKEQVRPILQAFVERIPGAFIEEKTFSLAWHYRRAEPEIGADAARELIDTLTNLTANLDLHVLAGHKVVEVKNSSISKGAFYMRYLAGLPWDFIVAAGDDWTDESLFRALPPQAYSLRVGLAASAARFNLRSPADVVALLQQLI